MPGYSILPACLDNALFIPASTASFSDSPSPEPVHRPTESLSNTVDALLRDRSASHHQAFSLSGGSSLPDTLPLTECIERGALRRTKSMALTAQTHVFWLETCRQVGKEQNKKEYWRHTQITEREARNFLDIDPKKAFFEVVPTPNPSTIDAAGRSLLHSATGLSDPEVLPYLLEYLQLPHSADENPPSIDSKSPPLIDQACIQEGYTALHLAVRAQDPEATALLLNHRARTDLRDHAGWRPIEHALEIYLKSSKIFLQQAACILKLLLRDKTLDRNAYDFSSIHQPTAQTLLDRIDEREHPMLYLQLRIDGALHLEEIKKNLEHAQNHPVVYTRRSTSPVPDDGLLALA